MVIPRSPQKPSPFERALGILKMIIGCAVCLLAIVHVGILFMIGQQADVFGAVIFAGFILLEFIVSNVIIRSGWNSYRSEQ